MIEKNYIQTLAWPPYSSALNPIENLWDELERSLKKHQPKNKQELEALLKQEWQEIELPVIQKLVDSVPSRLLQCIKIKGYATRY